MKPHENPNTNAMASSMRTERSAGKNGAGRDRTPGVSAGTAPQTARLAVGLAPAGGSESTGDPSPAEDPASFSAPGREQANPATEHKTLAANDTHGGATLHARNTSPPPASATTLQNRADRTPYDEVTLHHRHRRKPSPTPVNTPSTTAATVKSAPSGVESSTSHTLSNVPTRQHAGPATWRAAVRRAPEHQRRTATTASPHAAAQATTLAPQRMFTSSIVEARSDRAPPQYSSHVQTYIEARPTTTRQSRTVMAEAHRTDGEVPSGAPPPSGGHPTTEGPPRSDWGRFPREGSPSKNDAPCARAHRLPMPRTPSTATV